MDKGYVQNTIFELLSRLGIGYEKLEHSPIITMKEGSEIAYLKSATIIQYTIKGRFMSR